MRNEKLTRERERTMRRFKSPTHAQRFLSTFGPICDHFRPKRHRLSAAKYCALMQERFQVWNEVTEVKTAAERHSIHPQSSASSLSLIFLLKKLFNSLDKLTIPPVPPLVRLYPISKSCTKFEHFLVEMDHSFHNFSSYAFIHYIR